ncbi:STAS domain-containing protein [Streptomyces cyaneofuscatus]|uniref:STAS domain-containing protein n=1 Tax=Streptomyces cyaneofuscatus TaxID=66883 RepID=UPI00331BD885
MPTPPLLYVDRRQEGVRIVLVLAGAMDLHSVHVFTAALAAALRSGATAVHVDLSAVAFCDCSGLNALLEAAQDSRAGGRTFQAHGPCTTVLRLFTLTGTVGILLGRAPRAVGAAVGAPVGMDETATKRFEDRSAAPPV